MRSVMESYTGIAAALHKVRAAIDARQAQIEQIRQGCHTEIPARIAGLEQQLKTIDEYQLKIEAFRRLAERNLESRNLLTIEAPPNYRVNLNRLRQWAMMIDPTASHDPYAQRVYMVACCDLFFLEKKKKEFTQRIERLRADRDTGMNAQMQRLEQEIRDCRDELARIAAGEPMQDFVRQAVAENRAHWFETPPAAYADAGTLAPVTAPGALALPLELPEPQRGQIQAALGRFYDAAGGRVLLPLELDTGREFALSVRCVPARAHQLDRALQNFLLNILQKYPAGHNRVQVLDAVRFSSAALGSLKSLENTFAVAPVPRNPEQLTAALEQIVSSFADRDEVLELCDSVAEYNRGADADQTLPRTTLVVFGWPQAFEGRDREYMQRIMTNYERYGISFVCVSYAGADRQREQAELLPEYAAQNAVRVEMLPKQTTVRVGDGEPRRFVWYTLNEALPTAYAESLRACRLQEKRLGNEYPRRYDCVNMPAYTRAYRRIELPFGVDGKDRTYSAGFENENFAAYLVGASRSGKSTLLHTLIAGLIRGYHPDNLELWLADFKQLEFKRYIAHRPPHVKYILLDESTELVYDLIDKLTDKMMERQRLFARLGKERIDQIDPRTLDRPLPVIFVILDEFSIMSQAIAESQTYRLRLQNLLAKGAALGIRFLFSSQTFTTGVAGLTPTARAQIQQRIAMKGSREEISQTLELSAGLKTEQVRSWMEALPPHYALIKYRTGPDTPPQVARVLVMYFPDYGVRDRLIDTICSNMTPVEQYHPTRLETYVDKHPVLVDGNSYEVFPAGELPAAAEGEVPLLLGTPRLMVRRKPVPLTCETRENLLLIARMAEQAAAASIVTSAMRSFLCGQGGVQVWAYGKNSLYRLCRAEAWRRPEFAQLRCAEDMDAVCGAIRALKQRIRDRVPGRELIVLAGMDRICADFEFVENAAPGQDTPAQSAPGQDPRAEAARRAGTLPATPVDRMRLLFAARWDEAAARRDAEAAGCTGEEAAAFVRRARTELAAQIRREVESQPAPDTAPAAPAATATPATPAPAAYNALQDLQYVVKQGSRLGYHFLLVLNSLADLRATGLRLDWMRHRMAFQLSAEDSRELFGSRDAAALPEHICQYSDTIRRHSFRPYLHPGIAWDGWMVDEAGQAVNPFAPLNP